MDDYKSDLKREMFRLKTFILRAMFLTFIVNVAIIYATYIYMNAQYAGYENDIVWRLFNGGRAVPVEVQNMTREELKLTENIP
jgi:hypothetical protein